uniref:GpcrRhopsn4 domain-containing protein n=1 Tax=Haemonchus contortus TaxID=6289 RepID=A0A7I5EAN6_HAECO
MFIGIHSNLDRSISLLTAFVAAIVTAKRSFGTISTSEDFSYLDRFCFQSATGHLEYTLVYPANFVVPSLLLYYDSNDQWIRAYKELSVCEDRISVLTNRSMDPAVIRLDPYDRDLNSIGARCRLVTDVFGASWVKCRGSRTFQSMRSRWWFLALSACEDENVENKTSGLYVEYQLFMTNGEPSEVLRYQFSDDEWLILPTDIFFLLLQCGLLVINYIIGCQLSFRRLYHNTYRISTQSILLDVCGLSMMVIAYGAYALDGIGFPFLKLMAQLFRGFAQMFFIFMILLLSRGQNVTKMKLSKVDNVTLFCLASFFITSYIGMLFWEIKGFDPALVYFQSESIPGLLLAGWRIVAYIFFATNSYLTQRAYPGKKKFYFTFVTLLTPWFWASPIVLFIAIYVLDNWVRDGVTNIVDNCVISYGYIVFLYISWPSHANANFPFHIRTTQIDVSFDPQNAYQSKEETATPIPMDPMRPQITTAHNRAVAQMSD